MLEPRKEQQRSPWQHISYVSVPAGGWQCRERRGDISAADFEQLVGRVVTNFVSHKQLSSLPIPAEIAGSPRIFRYRFVAGAGYFVHAAQAGTDGSGRPNNVWSQVLKCADAKSIGAYPIEFWRSNSFFAPYGMNAVINQKLDAEPAPAPGSLVTVANESAFIFANDAEIWRQGVLAVLLDAVFMRKNEDGKPIVLVAESQDEAALWIGAVCRIADPNLVAELSFSLYERASQVARVLADGYDIVCVPYEDSDSLSAENAVVIHTYRDCELGDADTRKPHMLSDGIQVPVSAWSVAMLDEIASEVDYAELAGLVVERATPGTNLAFPLVLLSVLRGPQDYFPDIIESAVLDVTPESLLDDTAVVDIVKKLVDRTARDDFKPKTAAFAIGCTPADCSAIAVSAPGSLLSDAKSAAQYSPGSVPAFDKIPASQVTKDDRTVEPGHRDAAEKPKNIGDAIQALLNDYRGQEIPSKLINLLRFLDEAVLFEAFAVSSNDVSLRGLALPIASKHKSNLSALPPVAVWANARILAEKLLMNEPITLSEDLQGYLEDFIEHYKFRAASNEPIAYDLFGTFYVFAVVTDFFDRLSGNLGDAVSHSFSLDSEVLKTAVGCAREEAVKQRMLAWREVKLLSPDTKSAFMHKVFALVVMYRNGALDARAQDVLGVSMFETDTSLIRLCCLSLLEEYLLSVSPDDIDSLVESVKKIILRETNAGEIVAFKLTLRDKILSLIDDCRNNKPGGTANNSI